jgi:hypothetical protein
MRKTVVSFIIKVFLFILPVIVLSCDYLATDPFKVIYHYDTYYISGQPSYIGLNRDFVSTQTFINNYSKFHYDSFIFGNSRATFYQIKDWRTHIVSNRCFHFDASYESIYGIHAKIKFLINNKIPIKNALIILDNSTLQNTINSNGYLFIKHPSLSGQSWLLFQMEFVKAFFNNKFLFAYIDFQLSHKVKNYMKKYKLLSGQPIEYDIETNEIRFTSYEDTININPDNFYLSKMESNTMHQQYSPPAIKNEQKNLLNEIAAMLKQSGYRIVINPLYDKIKLNKEDYDFLCSIFGSEYVYDFSGINSITTNKYNYYDESHYQPDVASFILNEIYK